MRRFIGTLVLVVRTVWEDAAIENELAGYKDYAALFFRRRPIPELDARGRLRYSTAPGL